MRMWKSSNNIKCGHNDEQHYRLFFRENLYYPRIPKEGINPTEIWRSVYINTPEREELFPNP